MIRVLIIINTKCISGHINLILEIYLKLFESVVKFVTKVARIESE